MTLPADTPVLIVDPSLAVARIVRTLLAGRGLIEADTTSSGPEAVRMLMRRSYGLVVCERVMKPVNGLDLKTLMNGREDWATIPFVLMTQEDPADLAERTALLGIAGMVCKPFSSELLFAAIDRARG